MINLLPVLLIMKHNGRGCSVMDSGDANLLTGIEFLIRMMNFENH
jgi:hypothetical protein